MNVTLLQTGEHAITDQNGCLVAGPFKSNEDAWRWLDRAEHEPDVLPKRKLQSGRSNRRTVGNTPAR